MRKNEITINIENKFKYKSGEAKTLLLLSPHRTVAPVARGVQQKLLQAMTGGITYTKDQINAAKEKHREEEDDEVKLPSANEILMIVQQSSNVNYVDFFDDVETLLLSDCAKVNGQDRFEESYIDKIGFSEWEFIVGTYVANFIFASDTLKR